MRNIKVVEYNPQWEKMYQEEEDRIRGILKEELLAIYHIGSTSVPKLKAKPIIDMMPVVRDIEKIDAYNAQFETIGYTCMGEFGITGRRFYYKGEENRTHHIHIFAEKSEEDIVRHLAVRDYLIVHTDEAMCYGELKHELAQKYPHNVEDYCKGKEAFMKELEEKAVKWYRSGKKTDWNR